MKKLRIPVGLLLACSLLYSCDLKARKETNQETASQAASAANKAKLPPPDTTQNVKNYSRVIGWPTDKMPEAPTAFRVNKFAAGLRNPRWIYVAPNGDIFVSEAETVKRGKERREARKSGMDKSQNMNRSANRITLFRDVNQDGVPEERYTFLQRQNQPFGMLVLNNYFYVANTDGLWRYPYQPGQTRLNGRGEKILELPAGGYNNHWTRNIIANADGSKIYIAVGSGSNNGENGMEHEVRRACILEINPDGSGERIYASGLRNPVGMDWAPNARTLWTAVNERDELGDELVPDYLTSVKEGGFYGWPYAYFGQNEDPRMKGQRPDLVKKTLVPDVPLGAHTASLGLAFYKRSAFPGKYRGGAFIGQHGSWNNSKLVGYKVVFVPFENGKPSGPPEDFLTGFIADAEKNQVYGRPVGIAVLPDGSLLVSDDAANTIWRVAAK
ncbi:PQQ-dependent sugar dehydrogenase [Sabulibacter ruber]|uniref:PQQ-dependent sugar dehydrogenase n=1 Tax=Sabulibacter ruber TaxID=2811901 RepID=UPI001A95B40B|nr:sorbosone dehydrogenase family protein [Sabulibacter ruber]